MYTVARNDFRIVENDTGYEPQMRYPAGMRNGETFWFPLNYDGYWLEPEAYSYGRITKHVCMTKDGANLSIIKAMTIMGINLELVS